MRVKYSLPGLDSPDATPIVALAHAFAILLRWHRRALLRLSLESSLELANAVDQVGSAALCLMRVAARIEPNSTADIAALLGLAAYEATRSDDKETLLRLLSNARRFVVSMPSEVNRKPNKGPSRAEPKL
jgi:hypothetical protein